MICYIQVLFKAGLTVCHFPCKAGLTACHFPCKAGLTVCHFPCKLKSGKDINAELHILTLSVCSSATIFAPKKQTKKL